MKRIRECLGSSKELREWWPEVYRQPEERACTGEGCWLPASGGHGSPSVEHQGSCEEEVSMNKHSLEMNSSHKPGLDYSPPRRLSADDMKEKSVHRSCLRGDEYGDAVLSSSLLLPFAAGALPFVWMWSCRRSWYPLKVQPVHWLKEASFPWISHPRTIPPQAFSRRPFQQGSGLLIWLPMHLHTCTGKAHGPEITRHP